MLMLMLFWACTQGEHSNDALVSTVNPSLFTTEDLLCAGNVTEIDVLSYDASKLQGRDVVVVHKSKRSIAHYKKGVLREGACWPVGLGFTPEGHKQREGDGKTPEGWYTIADWPPSQYYGAMILFYPNLSDVEQGVKDGRLSSGQAKKIKNQLRSGLLPKQNSPLGGQLLIHGGGSSADWTLGCVAMDNDAIDMLRAGLGADKRAELLVLP